MSAKTINFLNIALILFVIYFLQGILYPSGSIISQTVLLLFLIIGLFCYLKTVLRLDNPSFVKLFILFYAILLITFLVSPKTVIGDKNEAIGIVSTFGQFKEISAFVLSFFISYILVRKKDIDDVHVWWFGIIIFILSILRFFFSRDLLAEENEMFTNNAGYFLVATVPYIPFIIKKKKVLGAVIAVILSALIIASAKRGAIVCLMVSLAFMMFYYLKSHKITFKRVFAILLLLAAAATFIYYSIESNEYLMSRIEKTQSEGIGQRSIAYVALWNHWSSDTNLFTFLFGNGMAQTITVWGNYAHNDWLELLIDNGLVGVVIYLMLFVLAFMYIRKMNIGRLYKLSAYLCLIIWFLKTVFSMGYTSMMNVMFCFLLGLIIGKNEFHKQNTIKTNNSDEKDIMLHR